MNNLKNIDKTEYFENTALPIEEGAPNLIKMQNFALGFECNVVAPLAEAGLERNKHNIFSILNINRQELRHSDFLAFLLDPGQSGDIGQQFLRNFFAFLAKDEPTLKLDFFKMFYGRFNDVVVRREVVIKNSLERIDLTVDLPIEKILVVIENKVDTVEHNNQLEKYKRFIISEPRYKDYKKIIFLYLSPDKTLPTDTDWIAVDYNLIFSALCKINTENIDNTLKILVNDYKKMIRSEFEMKEDKEIKSAAREIYRNYSDIFDIIFKYKPDRVRETAEIIHMFLSEKNSFITLESKKPLANIVFRTNELSSFKNIFFQIDIKNMLLYLFLVDGSDIEKSKLGKTDNKSRTIYIVPQKGFFDDSRKENEEFIKKHENFLKENSAAAESEFKSDIETVLNKLFSEDGWVVEQSSQISKLLLGADQSENG